LDFLLAWPGAWPAAGGGLLALLGLFAAPFLHESLAFVAGAALIARGAVTPVLAGAVLLAGIVASDLALYGLGRLARRHAWARRLAGGAPAAALARRMDRGMAWAIPTARLLPGLLFVTFVAYGWLGLPFRRFAAIAGLTAAVYTPVMLFVTLEAGKNLMPHWGAWTWPALLAALLLPMLAAQRVVAWRTARAAAADPGEPPVAIIDRLPKWLWTLPLLAYWLWLSLRYRSLTLPSLANPSISSGGLVGESKHACLALIDPAHLHCVAPTALVRPGENANAARQAAALDFPLIAKPDIGWCGYGVRRIADAGELAAYAAAFPRDGAYLLQKLIDAPGEAGLLYHRAPDEATGTLGAIVLRNIPEVVGDGRHSVAQLAARGLRTRRFGALYRAGLGAAAMARVPGPGERVRLATIASIRIGARYEDALRLATPALRAALDDIGRTMPGFHYGRFDVKFDSLADLQAGRFTILEVNGAGSESIQYWDPHVPLWRTYRGVFAKQRALFALADRLRAQGLRPMGLPALARDWLRQLRLTRRYPMSN